MPRRIAAAAGVLLAASAGVLLATQLQSSDSTSQPAGYFADRPLPAEHLVAAASELSHPAAAQPAPAAAATATTESAPARGLGRTASSARETSPPVVQTRAVPEPATVETATLAVLHLHRLGHCQGRLVVAPDAVSFVPDEHTGRDMFEFAYGEFLHTVDESTLTIRSHARTYRFKPTEGAGGNEGGLALAEVGAAITRFRRHVASPHRQRADGQRRELN